MGREHRSEEDERLVHAIPHPAIKPDNRTAEAVAEAAAEAVAADTTVGGMACAGKKVYHHTCMHTRMGVASTAALV